MPAFRMLVARTEIGRTVPLRIFRAGREEVRSVRLAERPDVEQTVEPAWPVPPSDELGLDFEPTAEEGVAEGARVRGVRAGSRASLAGVRPDDVIVAVDGALVRDGEQCEELIQKAEPGGRPAILRVVRRNETWFLGLPIRR